MKKHLKYTPGPWRIVEDRPLDFVVKKYKPVGQAICSVEKAFTTISIHAEPDGKHCPNVDQLDEQGEANARLIKSAPDLLETVKKLVRMARTSGGTAGPDTDLMEACQDAEKLLETIEPKE